MSLGYYAFCHKIAEDKERVLYTYGSQNWNDIRFENNLKIEDGSIEIHKEKLVEPRIKIRTFKSQGHKKTETKKIIREFDISKLINDRHIIIENTKNVWRLYEGIDPMAYRLCDTIFRKYQEDGYLGLSYIVMM